jgi:hypothetical protein
MAVESTFNWYWLVDGLHARGYSIDLANPAKIAQYNGIKHADDKNDAFYLAELQRLNILPKLTFTMSRCAQCGTCCDDEPAWCISAPPCC